MTFIPLPEPKPQDPSLSEFYRQPVSRYRQSKLERGCNPMLIELDASQLAELQGKGRIRGLYTRELKKFAESDSNGVQVDLTEGEFAGKAVATVVQGFRLAIDKENLGESVRVQGHEDNVYLIRIAS